MDGISARVVLGLAPEASRRDVKRAWRALAKQHHPDTGGERRSFEALRLAHDAAMAHEPARARLHPFLETGATAELEATKLADTTVVDLDRYRRRRAHRSFAEELELAMRRG